MKVREIMSSNVSCCGPRTSAAAIAEICWNKACGAVPVVDEKNRVLGMITDRDLFIALGTRNARAQDLVAEDVMSRDVASCSPDEDVKHALSVMYARKVRRLPVVDRDKIVKGIVSFTDIVHASLNGAEIAPSAVMNFLTRLSEHVPAGAAASRPMAMSAVARS